MSKEQALHLLVKLSTASGSGWKMESSYLLKSNFVHTTLKFMILEKDLKDGKFNLKQFHEKSLW
jgi:hypothetical protein